MIYTELSDKRLCELAQQKDSEAMETLIERYRYVVMSLAHSYFLLDGDLEDLIQVGMISVFKAIQTYNGKVEFKYYAIKCVKNGIITAIKKSNTNKNKALNNYVSIYAFSQGDNDKNSLFTDDNLDPERTYINVEAEKELKQKIKNALSKHEHDILSMYLQGYSYVEIAEKLSRSSKSIDNALQRIKKKLLVFYNDTESH